MPDLPADLTLRHTRGAQDAAAAAHAEPRSGAGARGSKQRETGEGNGTDGSEVLLEHGPRRNRDAGLWERPQLLDPNVPARDLRMTVRHAIMQVNYYVRIRSVPEEEVDRFRWLRASGAGSAGQSCRNGADGAGAEGC